MAYKYRPARGALRGVYPTRQFLSDEALGLSVSLSLSSHRTRAKATHVLAGQGRPGISDRRGPSDSQQAAHDTGASAGKAEVSFRCRWPGGGYGGGSDCHLWPHRIIHMYGVHHGTYPSPDATTGMLPHGALGSQSGRARSSINRGCPDRPQCQVVSLAAAVRSCQGCEEREEEEQGEEPCTGRTALVPLRERGMQGRTRVSCKVEKIPERTRDQHGQGTHTHTHSFTRTHTRARVCRCVYVSTNTSPGSAPTNFSHKYSVLVRNILARVPYDKSSAPNLGTTGRRKEGKRTRIRGTGTRTNTKKAVTAPLVPAVC